MGELKQHPLPMTIDEQIENLKSLGLIIENEEYAKKILNDISYFRLIKAYSLGFKPKNGKYEEGVTFEQIVELYLFNANFRQVTFAEIEKIEVNVRCRIANYFAEVYGVLGYMEPQNFVDEEYHRAFMADIEEEVRRNLHQCIYTQISKLIMQVEICLYMHWWRYLVLALFQNFTKT